ncbi:hypothetical protein ACFKHW_04250 [Bradyrhizobium lupini]|uniref:hypothetical protein n=1 Tax=Rhizobium lupini TaxID=136996 RepID=UPI00366AFFCE
MSMGVDASGSWVLKSVDYGINIISATVGGAVTIGNNSAASLTINRTGGLEPALTFFTDNAFDATIRGLVSGGLRFTNVNQSVEYMRIVSSSRVGIAGIITPTTSLEVSGTISATNFVGNGSGLTGIASTGDRIVSGSTNMVAEQTSGTVRVSGTLAMVNTGNEVCNAATWYSFRVNPSTGMMQMCRP